MKTVSCAGGINAEYLRECFDADFEAGTLRWRDRPASHFKSEMASRLWNARFAGKLAGSPHKEGYVSMMLTHNGRRRLLLAHRVMWCLHTDAWPEMTIDHQNCVRTDNRIKNLRAASYVDQNANRPVRAGSVVGLKGVTICRLTGRFMARINRGGRSFFLGRHDTAEAAHAAYMEAAKQKHGEFAKW